MHGVREPIGSSLLGNHNDPQRAFFQYLYES